MLIILLDDSTHQKFLVKNGNQKKEHTLLRDWSMCSKYTCINGEGLAIRLSKEKGKYSTFIFWNFGILDTILKLEMNYE